MSKTIRNEFDKQLTYKKLMIAHKLSRKGKGYRKDVILFNLKQEEYIMWLYEKLKNKFEDLSDEDKNALLIYKSRLGRAINSLDIEEK